VASGSALQVPAPELTLGEVRASFARVDAEADGRLDRRQADSGGISGEQFAQFDANADSLLDSEEYLVARQALAARVGRSVSADLGAESTCIQAAWRARRAPGPSARVELARRSQPAAQGGANDVKPAPSNPTPAVTPTQNGTATPEGAAPRAVTGSVPSKAGENPPAAAPGLGLSRLSQGAGLSEPQRSDASLEERARSAQELILARRKESGLPAREPVVVSPSRGPASRTALAEKNRAGAPSVGRTPPTQQAPPAASGARSSKPRSKGNGGN
jgi:hypothetical protein